MVLLYIENQFVFAFMLIIEYVVDLPLISCLVEEILVHHVWWKITSICLLDGDKMLANL